MSGSLWGPFEPWDVRQAALKKLLPLISKIKKIKLTKEDLRAAMERADKRVAAFRGHSYWG